MCEYCDGGEVVLLDEDEDIESWGEGVAIRMDGARREISAAGFYDGGYCCGSGSVEINYCPMCGRELRGESK